MTAEDSTGTDIGAILGSTSGTDTATVVARDSSPQDRQRHPLTGTGGLSLTLSMASRMT